MTEEQIIELRARAMLEFLLGNLHDGLPAEQMFEGYARATLEAEKRAGLVTVEKAD